MTDSAGRPPAAGPLAAVVSRLRAAGCVWAEEEAVLLVAAAASPGELEDLVSRRAAGLPLEQVLGWAEFCGLRIEVDPGVFVPRRRSEFLVSQAVAAAGQMRRSRSPKAADLAQLVVADLCCGSGAIGVAIAAAAGPADLHAADIDPAAVRCARRNVGAVAGHVYEGDLFAALPASLHGRVDILAVNAPYVPSGEIGLLPAEARLHEPRIALDGGPDGTALHWRVAGEAGAWLAPDGRLLIESSERQALTTAAAMTAGGFATTVLADDDMGATVVAGTRLT